MLSNLIGPFWIAVLLVAGALAGAIFGNRLVHSECSRSDDDYWVIMVFAVVIGAVVGFLVTCVLPVIIAGIVFFGILYLIGKVLKRIFG